MLRKLSFFCSNIACTRGSNQIVFGMFSVSKKKEKKKKRKKRLPAGEIS